MYCYSLFNVDYKTVSNTNKDRLMPHICQNIESQTRSKVVAYWIWSNIRLKWPNIVAEMQPSEKI